jgi:hypothetical protein
VVAADLLPALREHPPPATLRPRSTTGAERESVIATFWASVAASILVALVTTLLIEYLAKPRLEVRKDRILEADRKRRANLDDLHHCMVAAQEIVSLCDLPLEAELLHERAIERARGIEARLEQVWELDVPPDVQDAWLRLTAAMSATALQIQVDGPTADLCEYLDAEADLAFGFEVLLRTRRVRWIRRRSLKRKICERDDAVAADGPRIA